MGISVKDITTGRKTFFITPDTSLIPESYLEDFFALGYECYFVENDFRVSLEKKLEIILSLFHDVILFFNIDYNIQNLSWPQFISKIIRKYDNRVCVGVMYAKRQSKDDRARLEQKYLYEMGLNCGCIQLEYQKKINFDIIETILYANQARGKRRNIRAFCTNTCTYSCVYNGGVVSGNLQDISLSHFSFLFPDTNLDIKLYERVNDFRISIKGVMFRSDAVLIMKRELNGQVLHVFTYVSSEGSSGLDSRTKQILSPIIYNLMSSNCNNLINQMILKSENNGNLTEFDEIEDSSNMLKSIF